LNEEEKGLIYLDEDFIEEEPFAIIKTMTPEEIDFILEKDREIRLEKNERPALFWLAKELKLTRKENILIEALKLIRNGNGYRIKELPKKSGGKRKISVPDKIVKKLQRRINRYILSAFLRGKNSFGFSGGSILDALKPHLEAKCIMTVDFKNAFPTVTSQNIFDYFTEGRSTFFGYRYDDYGKTQYFTEVAKFGYFSWYAARILTHLTAYQGQLPQGAPTSPRLFDLLCKEIDKKLSKLAANVGGAYTRYADNIFFSFSYSDFPRPIRQAILKIIEGEGRPLYIGKNKHFRPAPHFGWHKLKVKTVTHDSAIRLLGLNMLNQKIHNTRDFKRNLRLSLHHVNWLLDNGFAQTEKFEVAWKKLQGQMNFAVKETLPKNIIEGFSELEKRIL
jgi:hypothetical protein